MPYEAELAKLNELLTKSHSSASLRDRQAFQEYLLHLASLPSYDMKSRFAIHIHRTFATFDQDQDPVIDAVMDLCEDKDLKIRILGIRALRSTATADPRWVKGNIGVLLQLLDSSGEELREVHKALKALIAVDPVVAFQSIAKDLLSDDAGVSRSKVIRFLWEEAKPERRDILESGKNVDAERAFQKAFEEVLDTLKRGSDDYHDVHDMLRDLSIRNTRRSPSPRRASQQRPRSPLPPSRPAGPSSGRLPPRSDDRFRHQPPSVPPTGPRRDAPPTGPPGPRARSPPRGPGASAAYARGPPVGPRQSGNGSSYQTPSSGYRDSYSDNRRPGPDYRSNDYRDRPQDSRERGRSDRSPRWDGRYPSGPGARYRDDSPGRYRPDDRRVRSPDRRRDSDRRSRSRSRSPPGTRPNDSRDRARHSPHPTEAKKEQSTSEKPEIAQAPRRAQQKTDPNPLEPLAPTTATTTASNGAPAPSTVTSIGSVASLPAALPEARKPDVKTMSIRGEKRLAENGDTSADHQISIAGAARPDSFSGRELLSAPADAPGPLTIDEPAPVRSLKDRLDPKDPTDSPATPRSLADRIGEASSGKGKRRRDGDAASVDPSRPQLLARISSSHDPAASRDTKKARSGRPGSIEVKSSLLSRMSGAPGSGPSTPALGPPSTPTAGGAPGSELSIRNASTSRNGPSAAGFSIKGVTPTPTPSNGTDYFPNQMTSNAAAAQTPGLAKTMSIRSAGTTSGISNQPTAPPANPDEGVRRKGRGFSRAEGPGAESIFQLPGSSSAAGPGNAVGAKVNGGGLASRLGGRR